MESVDPREAYTRQQAGWTYVDVRSGPEFHSGRPNASINIPAFVPGPLGMAPITTFVADVLAQFDRETPLLIGCAAGGRSMRAIQQLEAAGFTRLVNVDGGFLGGRDAAGRPVAGWRNAGLPVAAG